VSKLLISQYRAELEKIYRYGGSKNERSTRGAFERLLNGYCQPRNLLLIPELDYKTKNDELIWLDGTVKDAIRLDHGWWEAKDVYDDLDEEIENKIVDKGYPDENILFEDSQTAVLIQRGKEKLRTSMEDVDELDGLITQFIDYERKEVRDFRAAIKTFREDIPRIIKVLRNEIKKAESENEVFRDLRSAFLDICRQSINPEIELFDVNEMLIQHMLTEDIFVNIFSETQFHRENNIAREISGIINTFFTGSTKRNALRGIEHYYSVIRRKSASIVNHHEKQKFLKAVYENFYKAYNPKAADRLGIVYTPNEIVRFMIESADYLTHKHFGKLLSDPGVEILDPCTGTGTYVTELIEYLPADKLEHKYKHEIHCNEVAILPYYIANLNIEFTYQQKMFKYEEFKNICLVDTLDHCTFEGRQFDLFAMSVQNTERISQQNSKNISVVIGNPPYNAWQANFNDANANRSYGEIDKRIKSTYIKHGKAQNKISVYDMYTRFYRWASDRIDEGVICLITNSSFLHKKAFDGFRKCIQEEFSEAYFLDCGGDVREISGRDGVFICEKHTIFGEAAMTGIAIGFLIKKKTNEKCKIHYSHPFDIYELREEKIKFIAGTPIESISFQNLNPDKKYNWVNLTDNDFEEFIPLTDKKVKNGTSEESIFTLFSRGVETTRDEWVYDFSQNNLSQKIIFFIDNYNHSIDEGINRKEIKWSSSLINHASNKIRLAYQEELIVKTLYRPYCSQYFYSEKIANQRLTKNHYEIFGTNLNEPNFLIGFMGQPAGKPFAVIATSRLPDLNCISPASGGTQCLPLYRYNKSGERIDNITDWGLIQFQTHYTDPTITKLDIFHYTYAVLHNPSYRIKYELNFKREFPRLPYYSDFHKWTTWGKDLMDLHLTYEAAKPYGMKVAETASKKRQNTSRCKLKADKEKGHIILDAYTTLTGVPPIAWTYKLGNRSALEWILDQYKEKKPKDPTIREKFNTYRFADYKEQVIDLLDRVCTVSVETMKIIEQMPSD
jgi:predicted helicase